MKKCVLFFLCLCLACAGFSQSVKVNQFDKFLKKQRLEFSPVVVSGLANNNRLSLTYSALAPELYLTLEGTGWGAFTIDAGNELLLLFSNDSTIRLKSPSLQSFEPSLTHNSYKHQYVISRSQVEALSMYDLTSIRKYSFNNFSDVGLPKSNVAKIKQMSQAFLTELKKLKGFEELKKIELKDVYKHVGDSVEFCSKIFQTRYFQNSKDAPTVLDVQAEFSDPPVQVLIMGKDRFKFNQMPEKLYLNKAACISGVVELRDNVPYLIVSQRQQIRLTNDIDLQEIDFFEGDSISVSGQVFTARYLEDSKTKPTLLNVGAPFPDQPLTLVIEYNDRTRFGSPETMYQNKIIKVKGLVTKFKGKSQIILRDPQQIEIIGNVEAPVSATSASQAVVDSDKKTLVQPIAASSNETVVPESQPEFPGGQAAFADFLAKNLETPDVLRSNEQKKVVATFQISPDGVVSNIQIVQSAGFEFDKEVKRVLSKMPRWTPGLRNGQYITTTFTQPVTFTNVR